MYLIVGLGNPEPEYSRTRHNMGFDVINKLSEKYNIKVEKKGLDSLYGTGIIENEKVILCKPQTYMNLSGEAIIKFIRFYKIDLSKVIIIYDDIDLNPGDVKKVEFYVQVDKLPSIEEYYSGTEEFEIDDNGNYLINGKILDNIPEVKLVCESTITAKDLAKEIKTEDGGILVEKANIVAEEVVATEDNIAKVNETITSKISVKNNSRETLKNINVIKQLPQGLKYSDSYTRGYEEDGITLKKINNTDYDISSRTVVWHIDELEAGRTTLLIGEWVVGEMAEGVYKDRISTVTTVNANGENYSAGQVDIDIGRPYLEVSQVADQTNQYIKVGDSIEYTFTVKNLGSVRAQNITLTDKLPSEVKIKSLTYNADGVEV